MFNNAFGQQAPFPIDGHATMIPAPCDSGTPPPRRLDNDPSASSCHHQTTKLEDASALRIEVTTPATV